MNRILKYINDHIEAPIKDPIKDGGKLTLTHVASLAGYSTWHFCEKFKAYTGRTFHEYVATRRMQLAVRYLLDGESVACLSERLGYASVNGFKKAFLKEFGVMPSEYIKRESSLSEEYRKRQENCPMLSARCTVLRDELFRHKGIYERIRGHRLYCFTTTPLSGEPLCDMTEALCRTVQFLPPLIADGELIVGLHYDDPAMEEKLYFETANDERVMQTYLMNSDLHTEQKQELFDVMRSGTHRLFAENAVHMGRYIRLDTEIEVLYQDSAILGFCNTDNHAVPHVRVLLEKGFSGLYDLLMTYPDTRFYTALRRLCATAASMGDKYADEAERRAADAIDETVKHDLMRVAAVCRRVPRYGARTFHEALQTVWFSHMLNTWEDGVNANSLGRLDVWLYPYYRRDIEEGRITREEAFELICCLWIKLAIPYDVQQCTLGGRDVEGNDQTNELSYMMLDAMEVLDIPRCLSVRWHRGTDRAFLRRAFEILRHTQRGIPSLFNDEIIIPALTAQAISPEDAADYCLVGCVEPTVGGKANQHSASGNCNLLKSVEYVLGGGRSLVSDTLCIPQVPPLSEFDSFSRFLEEIKRVIAYMLDRAIEMLNRQIGPTAAHLALPYKTLMTSGCVESGRLFNAGGATYNYYQIMQIGFPNLIDSLTAIRVMVYEKGRYTLEELRDLLCADFPDDKERDRFLYTIPKFGNYIDQVGALAEDIFTFICDHLDSQCAADGGRLHAQFFSFVDHMNMGKHTAASPDGRRRGEYLASGMQPMPGNDFNGLSAYFKQLSDLPCLRAAGTVSSVIDVCPYLFAENNMERFLDLLTDRLIHGLCCLHVNIVDPDILREAMRDPQQYSDLEVNVSGFCRRFTELPRDLQYYILQRTKHWNM